MTTSASSALSQLLDEALPRTLVACCSSFGIPSLKPPQELAMRLLLTGYDTFVSFPTGFGKSIIYQMLPAVASHINQNYSDIYFPDTPIVLVVSPLRSLMSDQVSYLTARGIKAAVVGENEDTDLQIRNGDISVVFGSPEALLTTPQWREAFQTGSLQGKFIAVAVDEAHTVLQWGVSIGPTSRKKEPFRKWCGMVGELRSFVKAPMIALTATASRTTRGLLVQCLGLTNCVDVVLSPDRPNVRLSVARVTTDFAETFCSLVHELRAKNVECERCLVYCRSIKACSTLYATLHHALGSYAYWPDGCERISANRLIHMYHSETHDDNKKVVLESLRDPQGKCRVVLSTSALGMGVDMKGVHIVIHLGPPGTIAEYMQEIGRAGRDGQNSYAILLFTGRQTRMIDKDMKEYVSNTCQRSMCRRRQLLSAFDETCETVDPPHKCCDVCTLFCKCEVCKVSESSLPDLVQGLSSGVSDGFRRVSDDDRAHLEDSHLEDLLRELEMPDVAEEHYDIVEEEELKQSLTDTEINQIMRCSSTLFTIDDIIQKTNITSLRVAQAILVVFQGLFSDCKFD